MFRSEKSQRTEELQRWTKRQADNREIAFKLTHTEKVEHSQIVLWISGHRNALPSYRTCPSREWRHQPGISAPPPQHFSGRFREYKSHCQVSNGNSACGMFLTAASFFIRNSATGAGTLQSSLILGLINILSTGYNVKL